VYNKYEYAILTALEQLNGVATTRKLAKRADAIANVESKWSSTLFGRTAAGYQGMLQPFYRHLNSLLAEGVITRISRTHIAFTGEMEDAGWQQVRAK